MHKINPLDMAESLPSDPDSNLCYDDFYSIIVTLADLTIQFSILLP